MKLLGIVLAIALTAFVCLEMNDMLELSPFSGTTLCQQGVVGYLTFWAIVVVILIAVDRYYNPSAN